jgi:succinoglycan biosynthesis transport protein ExoP
MELRQYFAVVRRYWWLLVLTSLLGGGAAYFMSASAPRYYRASATLEINQASDPRSDLAQVLRTSEMVASNYVPQVKAPAVLNEVKSRLGLNRGISGLIGVDQVGSTQLIRVSAQTDDPGLAQALANTTVQVFIELETQQQQARFQSSLNDLEAQIEDLEATIAKTQAEIASLGNPQNAASEFTRLELSRLEGQLARDQTRLVVLLTSAEEFRLAMARYTDDITIFAAADSPGSPISPLTPQKTLLGLITGLMTGVGIAFLLEYLDDTVKSTSDVREHLSAEVLGSLPHMKEENGVPQLVVMQRPRQPISEAFRNLRTSIEFLRPDQPLRTIMVTSPQPSEGKSFIAANLAAVMAQAGRSVILVDGDLRNPQQHHIFDLSRKPGLTDVFISWMQEELDAGPDADGRISEEAWKRLYPQVCSAPDPSWALQQTAIVGLRLLSSGQPAPNPAELLGSRRMHELLAWLKQEAEVVIFDTPPVLAVTDASVLSSQVDGSLLTLEMEATRLPAAVQAVERLLRVEDNFVGVVLNRVSPSENGFGYAHYYNYYYEKEWKQGEESLSTRIMQLVNPRRRERKNRLERRQRSKEGK